MPLGSPPQGQSHAQARRAAQAQMQQPRRPRSRSTFCATALRLGPPAGNRGWSVFSGERAGGFTKIAPAVTFITAERGITEATRGQVDGPMRSRIPDVGLANASASGSHKHSARKRLHDNMVDMTMNYSIHGQDPAAQGQVTGDEGCEIGAEHRAGRVRPGFAALAARHPADSRCGRRFSPRPRLALTARTV